MRILILKKNNNLKLTIIKIKGIVGFLIFIILIVQAKISHLLTFDIPLIIWFPLCIFSLWLMGDWFKTWFK